MRVVYLFVSKGGAKYKSNPDWNPKFDCSPNHTEKAGLETEGTFYILDKLHVISGSFFSKIKFSLSSIVKGNDLVLQSLKDM
jgi:hypothetical protein